MTAEQGQALRRSRCPHRRPGLASRRVHIAAESFSSAHMLGNCYNTLAFSMASIHLRNSEGDNTCHGSACDLASGGTKTQVLLNLASLTFIEGQHQGHKGHWILAGIIFQSPSTLRPEGTCWDQVVALQGLGYSRCCLGVGGRGGASVPLS